MVVVVVVVVVGENVRVKFDRRVRSEGNPTRETKEQLSAFRPTVINNYILLQYNVKTSFSAVNITQLMCIRGFHDSQFLGLFGQAPSP